MGYRTANLTRREAAERRKIVALVMFAVLAPRLIDGLVAPWNPPLKRWA